MKRTMIISAFPACGKTYLFREQNNIEFETGNGTKRLTFSDSDSSKFNNGGNWYGAYVDYIESLIGTVDFIFVSQHDEVLEELSSRNIPFVVVVPMNTPWMDEKQRKLVKNQWFGRFLLRDNSHIHDVNKWMKSLMDNYDKWTSIDSLTKYNPVSFFLLNEDEYLSDIIPNLYFKKENFDCYIRR